MVHLFEIVQHHLGFQSSLFLKFGVGNDSLGIDHHLLLHVHMIFFGRHVQSHLLDSACADRLLFFHILLVEFGESSKFVSDC